MLADSIPMGATSSVVGMLVATIVTLSTTVAVLFWLLMTEKKERHADTRDAMKEQTTALLSAVSAMTANTDAQKELKDAVERGFERATDRKGR
jgi:hemoglobin-like flavoprotein